MKTIKTLTMGIFMAAMGTTAMAQLPNWGCSEEVQQEMMTPVSLYQDAIKQYKATKDTRWLEEAYPNWHQVVANCPKQSKNLYINGTNIMRVMIAKAKTPAERDTLIEELMRMYDTRIANYGEAPKWTAKKAMELEELMEEAGLERYYALYDQAVRMDGELEAAYLVKYMEATINYVRAGKAEPTLVVDNYDIASEKLEDELQKKEYSKAIEYLKDAVEGVTTQKDKYKAYLYLGHAYNGARSYSAARTAYNNAAETDRTKGEPYRMIASMYASSASSATEDNINGHSVYWAAVDKLVKSKSVDSSEENVEACNRLISAYSSRFPKQGDAFMAGLENGNRFTVPGWIGESTVVRTIK